MNLRHALVLPLALLCLAAPARALTYEFESALHTIHGTPQGEWAAGTISGSISFAQSFDPNMGGESAQVPGMAIHRDDFSHQSFAIGDYQHELTWRLVSFYFLGDNWVTLSGYTNYFGAFVIIDLWLPAPINDFSGNALVDLRVVDAWQLTFRHHNWDYGVQSDVHPGSTWNTRSTPESPPPGASVPDATTTLPLLLAALGLCWLRRGH